MLSFIKSSSFSLYFSISFLRLFIGEERILSTIAYESFSIILDSSGPIFFPKIENAFLSSRSLIVSTFLKTESTMASAFFLLYIVCIEFIRYQLISRLNQFHFCENVYSFLLSLLFDPYLSI